VIRATFPGPLLTAATDEPRRRIAGVAVPWNTPGIVSSGETVIFHPGSLDASARPVALRDHDRARPIGRVADATDTGRQLNAAVAVTPGLREGDDALVLAADGVLMFSVGANPTVFDYDAAGRMHVHAADWQELSLLSIGAYADALVTQVAAAAATPEGTAMPPDLLDLSTDDPVDPPPDDDVPDEEPNDDIEPDVPATSSSSAPSSSAGVSAGARPVPVTAAGSAGRRAPGRNPYAHLGIRQVAALLMAGRRGDVQARRTLNAAMAAQGSVQAALTDVTLVGTNNVGPAYRPAYQAELVDIISWGTPLIDALRQGDLERGDYPNKTFNQWVLTPEVALQTAEKQPIHSAPVSIEPASAAVQSWAGGNDISQQTLDLGSPSFVEDYIRAAGIDYARQSDTYAVATLMAIAETVTTADTDSFIAIIGMLIGALDPATSPPGGYFACISQDVGVGLIGLTRDEGPAFWDGHVNFGRFTTEVTNDAGLRVFVDPNMPARSYLLGHREGATWYDLPGTPFNLRAVNVGNLGLDIAVYGYGALGVQYPGAFAKTTVPVPVP
jgi:hypothetical protein